MRQTISGLVAAIAVMTASAVPAMACGGGLFQGSCSPCGQAYVEPCAQAPVYVAPEPSYSYSGCNSCGGAAAYERLPDPERQYYYVNQGPAYSGPGNFAPYPTYQEGALPTYHSYRHHSYRYGYAPRAAGYEDGGGYEGPRHYGYRNHFRPWHHTGYRYNERPAYRYGYAPHRGYAPHFYAPRHSMRYGSPMGMPRAYGNREHMMREHTLRRYN
jgi:hypothetical protein